jgi:ATP-dependent HslUV protease ATP-binding subunit HslU
MSELTPKEIVKELDKYIFGQEDAKKAVAIALRNRWRRKHLDKEIQEEIYPSNILMVGPTGVGKSKIARMLAKLINAPFLKVEATKFTEVGYVGKDVESIIRDLVDISVNMHREKMRKDVQEKAIAAAEAKIISALVGINACEETKKKFYKKFKKGALDEQVVQISIAESQDNIIPIPIPILDVPNVPSGQVSVMNISDVLGKTPRATKTKNVEMKVRDVYEITILEEGNKLVDEDSLIKEAIDAVENCGIVFIDEIDKIISKSEIRNEVSREGVQRDLLPILDSSTVNTKYGAVKTDHILFIASGAFHKVRPSDLLPELRGRLPIRVELKPLTEKDLVKILKEPKYSLVNRCRALFAVENVNLNFTDSGIKEIAKIATYINKEVENIGARRLYTILEKLLECANFSASDTPGMTIKIDKKYVSLNLADITKKQDLSKFIL